MSEKAERPLETLRDGSIKATIWKNEGENGPFLTTTLTRVYSDERGNLHDVNGFSGPELLRVAELARDAYRRSNELRRELKVEPAREADTRSPAGEAFERENGAERTRRYRREPR